AAFNSFFAETLEKAAADGGRFTVLSIDLDRFKETNDVYGHSAGDALLQKVAQRMLVAAQGTFVARIGGDEFILILAEGEQPMAAGVVAERLLAAFADDFLIDDKPIQIGLSIGGAVYPTDGTDAKTLMANADAALYKAKAAPHVSLMFFQPEMGAQLQERHNLQHELRQAIAQGELELHYQPQFRIAGKVIGFEALARWHSPTRGQVPPSTFIPIAEESSLIIPLGEWALRAACREAASWAAPLVVAVNVSPIQFHHGDLPGLVHTILLETGLPAARLELEITEGVLINDFSRAVSILRRLKALGVQIALDDFGTGYSSLSYLHAFAFDKIKIDRAFISDLETNNHSMAIVRAVVGLGHSLKIPILAEGVETECQHAFLVTAGCDQIQGYLVGRPFPIERYAALVGGRPPTVRPRAALG
ncbi:MAG TPA: bifunctional diguanylate cyclase/phosphodiesterase, partial [Rhizomicrobium sp.]